MKSTNSVHRLRRSRSPRRFSKTSLSLGLTIGLATAGLGAGMLAPSASAQIHEICTASEGWTPDHKITHGHQDMTVLSGNGLEPALIDDSSGESLSYGSGRSVVEVSNDQHVKLDALGISGLPDEGWYLPQTQLPNVPWLGFSTMYLGDHLVEGESVSMNLNLKQGPGRMIGWLPEGFGSNKIVLDSDDADDAWPIPYNTHVHTGFVFEKAGVYEVGFEFKLPRGGTKTLDVMFLVGDYDCADRGSTSTGTNSGSKSKGTSGKPKTFGDHLTAMEKEISQTEKAISGIEKSVRKLVAPFTKEDDKKAPKPNASGKPGAPGAPGAPNAGNKPAPAKPGQPGANGDAKPAPAGGGPKPAQAAPNAGGGAAPAPAPAPRSGGANTGGSSAAIVPAKAPAPAPAPAPSAGGSGAAPGLEAAPVEGAEGANLSGVDGQGDAFASADGAAQRGATSANYKPTSSSMSFFSGLILGLGVFAFALGIGIYVVMWQRSRNK
ncbi:choice-of-anchor M domain-containing protein [Corynebacterium pseudodiphtheriticum]|uniref:choice-of-anchor M domain-containing protein n=1 Tax=Corynebacterium pseudodiphtheriticum TaxID=37637 RepID=UPI000F8831A6|nr:choice-of-anchor M domain-containing protein [Corynebacterium pseudodiphtheriticum]MDK4305242.1 choice-of-anchor M domain-containing protein [Corynebacterium pseudodiphtheriticum]RUP94290.1 hypothetical protein D8M19_04425 [Corynebacterium pseudodiphtheriticum]RUQ00266.1 hypothetical protein D8M17_05730 [Corynebacterium pseudodiphtheriticum]